MILIIFWDFHVSFNEILFIEKDIKIQTDNQNKVSFSTFVSFFSVRLFTAKYLFLCQYNFFKYKRFKASVSC